MAANASGRVILVLVDQAQKLLLSGPGIKPGPAGHSGSVEFCVVDLHTLSMLVQRHINILLLLWSLLLLD